jgi:hypothetical protein
VLRAKSLSHGARNGRRIGTMSVFVQTVAARHVDAGCADVGLKAKGGIQRVVKRVARSGRIGGCL